MTGAAAQALLSHWRRRPGQALALILGLMLATALWSAVQAINAEARASYDRAAASLAQDQLARLVRPDGQPIPVEDYLALRGQGYQVSPVIELRVPGENGPIRVIGVDALTAPQGMIPPEITDGSTDFAAFSGAAGGVLAHPDTIPDLPADLGTPIAAAALAPGLAVTDIATAARLAGRSMPDHLVLHPAQPFGLGPVEEVTSLERRAPVSAADLRQLTGSFHLNLTAFGFLSFGVGLFIVHGAIGLAVEQRRAMIRTLRALGLPLSRLLALLAVELVMMALIAGIAGLVLGYLVAAALLPGVAGTLRGLYGAPVAGELSFDPVWAAAGLGMALAGTAAAGGQALLRVARMPVLAPARPRAWALQSRTALARQAQLAILCLLGSGVLMLWPAGLIVGFLCLALLLIGAALILPWALSTLLSLARPLAPGAFGGWLLADTRQQVPGLSLALMALLLALSANIGVSTMVGSFRGTFIGWLDQRLASELYVQTESEAETAALLAFLETRAEAVLPIRAVSRPILGGPGEIFGVVDHATYRDHWPLLQAVPTPWEALHSGHGVMINEQLARREGLGPGDPIALLPDLTLTVLAIYSDYGNPAAQAILGDAQFAALFPDLPARQFGIRIAPEAADTLAQDLIDTLGLPRSALIPQAELKALSLRVFERTFLVTGALNVLTLGVAAIALLTSFVTLAAMRLPQVAPVWAMGQPRSRLMAAEIARSLGLAALTFVIALPFGLALAWVLLAVINVEAFGWRLPMQFFPLDWLRLGALALLAAGLAALWPALRLRRLPPADLLRVFAHER